VAAQVRHHIDQTTLKAILASQSGAVAKDLYRRGKKVEAAAKRNLARPPQRVNTGLLRSSIRAELVSTGGALVCQIGTNVYYAWYVHEGTGIYGPKGAMIVPKTATVLSWKVKGGKRIFAMRVKGMRPNPFLKDALSAAKD
jgi:hypothetical protein